MKLEIAIDYDPTRVRGIISKQGNEDSSPIWERLKARFASNSDVLNFGDTMDMPWPEVLGVIREFGSASVQNALNFRLIPSARSREKVAAFVAETKKARRSKDTLCIELAGRSGR